MKVTITAKTHPLFGQQFDMYEESVNNDNSEVTLKLPNGERLTIHSNLTDFVIVPADASPSTLCLLDLEGLREIVKLVGQVRDEESE